MSEEHDVEFTGYKKTELCESEEVQDSIDTRAISDSASDSTGENSAINKEKEGGSSNNYDDKNESPEVKNVGGATIQWVQEDELFKVSWNLPEDTTSTKDYVALCCKGESIFLNKFFIVILHHFSNFIFYTNVHDSNTYSLIIHK